MEYQVCKGDESWLVEANSPIEALVRTLDGEDIAIYDEEDTELVSEIIKKLEK